MSSGRTATVYFTETEAQLRVGGLQPQRQAGGFDGESFNAVRDTAIKLLRFANMSENVDRLLVIVADKRPPVEFAWQRKTALPDARELAAAIRNDLAGELHFAHHFGINAGLNQSAAWTIKKFEVAPTQAPDDGITCSITCSDRIYYAISLGNRVIDTAVLELNGNAICFETFSGGKITEISSAGELFLNATNKPVHTAAVADADMLVLVGNLLGETIVQLAHRKRAPQIARRLLSTSPLYQDYEINKYRWSPFSNQLTPPGQANIADLIVSGIDESFKEREIIAERVESGVDYPLDFEDRTEPLEPLAIVEKPAFPIVATGGEDLAYAPVFIVSHIAPGASNRLQHLGYRLDEWTRRVGSADGSNPLCFIESPSVNEAELARLFSVLRVPPPTLITCDRDFARGVAQNFPQSNVFVSSNRLRVHDDDYAAIVQSSTNGFLLHLRRLLP